MNKKPNDWPEQQEMDEKGLSVYNNTKNTNSSNESHTQKQQTCEQTELNPGLPEKNLDNAACRAQTPSRSRSPSCRGSGGAP